MNMKIATVICSIVWVAFLILLFFIPLTPLDDWMTHSTAPRVPLFCSYQILTSSVIYYWTEARQLGIYLFYIIKNYDVIFTSVLQ